MGERFTIVDGNHVVLPTIVRDILARTLQQRVRDSCEKVNASIYYSFNKIIRKNHSFSYQHLKILNRL